MHEYSLHGQVASSRHTQLLNVLAGISAMPPVPLLKRHLIFRPTVIPTRQAAQVGGSQEIQDASKLAARQAQATNIDVYYLELVETLGDVKSSNVNEKEEEDQEMQNGEDINHNQDSMNGHNHTTPATATKSSSTWHMVFHDVPEPAARPVTARMINATKIDDGDAVSFMEGLGYTCISQYLQHGHSFTYQDIALQLTRILLLPEAQAAQLRLRREDIPPEEQCRLLDPSGAYTLHAAVCVADASKPEVVSRATSQLLQFKSIMKGIVDMRVVERLSLDTRVKG